MLFTSHDTATEISIHRLKLVLDLLHSVSTCMYCSLIIMHQQRVSNVKLLVCQR